MILQFTSCGIHKDDLIFEIDSNSIKKFGSQGQQKSFLISLRFAEFEFLKNNNNLSPILLMDDIFDKLDIQRVKNIVDLVNSSEFGQLFVSDTDKTRIEKVLKSLKNSSKIFTVTIVSRLLKDKGILEFCEVASMAAKKGLIIKFLIVGEIDEFNPMTLSEKEVLKLSKINNLNFLGYRSDVPNILSNSDILTSSFKGTNLLVFAFISVINKTVVSKFDLKPLW